MTKLFYILFLIFSLGCSKDKIHDAPTEKKLTIGVFGGSVSSRPESEVVKNEWRNRLGIQLITKGVGGAGFSSLTPNNIPNQIEYSAPYDIYILWASTNDAVYAPMGRVDNFDEKTQSGGIYKSITLIKKKNPKAIILFFNSLPAFNIYYTRIGEFATSQKQICDVLNIPCLDQYTLCNFTFRNYINYYNSDTYHLLTSGYLKLLDIQYNFIYENIKDKIADYYE